LDISVSISGKEDWGLIERGISLERNKETAFVRCTGGRLCIVMLGLAG
jgi:hypothetical protein